MAATLFGPAAIAADDAALAQCAAVSVDAARLACYDALAGRPATATPGAVPDAAAPSEADFGKPPAPRPEPESIRARIVGPTKELKPGTLVKLDNGQVWKVSTETGSSYRGIPDDAEVVITKGWLGSYWMEVVAIKRQLKVRRVS